MKKTAFLLAAAIAATISVPAAAQENPPVYSAVEVRELSATYYAWNGKTPLKAGRNYAVTGSVKVSKNITIPEGTKLTVMNGARLWVTSKGALNINGTLTVKKGGVLAVTNRLSVGESGSLGVSGEIRFNAAAKAALSGKVRKSAVGAVSGMPAELSGLGAKALFPQEFSDIESIVGMFYQNDIGAALLNQPQSVVDWFDEMTAIQYEPEEGEEAEIPTFEQANSGRRRLYSFIFGDAAERLSEPRVSLSELSLTALSAVPENKEGMYLSVYGEGCGVYLVKATARVTAGTGGAQEEIPTEEFYMVKTPQGFAYYPDNVFVENVFYG